MEDLLRVIVLGIVQGLTEFLPVSSSGHLILAREFFGWEFEDDLTLDVALHLGTTAAVLGFFWREWALMGRGALDRLARRQATAEPVYNQRLLALLILGSIPAAVAGFALESYIEDNVRSEFVVGAMLIVFAAVLYAAERAGSLSRGIEDCASPDALWVGLAQAVALVPGVSRSGVTMTAGLTRGFTRQDAARFSFLLSTPVIVGAGALRLVEAFGEGVSASEVGTMLAGALVAAATGWLSIRYLLRFLGSATFLPFVVYRCGLGMFVLVYFAF
jgi:undecaprenyl-diphosphatase